MKRSIYILILIFILLALSSCGVSSSSDNAQSVAPEFGYSDVMEEAIMVDDAEFYFDENYQTHVPEEERKITKDANMSLNIDDIDTSSKEIEDYIQSIDGYIASINIYGTKGSRHGYMEIKVPSESFDDVLNTLESYGKLIYLSKSTEDITQEYNYTSSYLQVKEEEYNRLSDLSKNESLSIEDKIEIEKQLASVSHDLTLYRAKQDLLENQLKYSTINLDLNEDNAKVQIQNENSPLSYFKKSISFTGEILQGICMVIVFLIPPLLVFAIVIVLPITIVIRKIKRKRNNNDTEV